MSLRFAQELAHSWAVRSFGADHVADSRVRALRTVEEVVELAQAVGVPLEQVRLAAGVVYSRPAGSIEQEAGGSLMTLLIFCEAHGLSAEVLLEREIARVLGKSPEHFAARNQTKLEQGLTG